MNEATGNPTMRDLAVYVLARTDLPSMNPGKLAAQVHHAGVQLMNRYYREPLVRDYITLGKEGGAADFNTTIVLGATRDQITQILHNVEWGPGPTDCLKGEIIDPSYPFVVESMEIANLIPQNATTKIIKVLDNGKVLMVRPELTVAWVLGDRLDTRFRAWFDGLELHA